MKEIVKKSKPTFFGAGELSDEAEQALQNGVYETKAQKYNNKENRRRLPNTTQSLKRKRHE